MDEEFLTRLVNEDDDFEDSAWSDDAGDDSGSDDDNDGAILPDESGEPSEDVGSEEDDADADTIEEEE